MKGTIFAKMKQTKWHPFALAAVVCLVVCVALSVWTMPIQCDVKTKLCDYIAMLTGVCTLIFGVIAAKTAWDQWILEKKARRAELLKDLVCRFNDASISRVFYKVDAGLSKSLLNPSMEKEVDTTLLFFAYLCYLFDRDLLDEDGFGFFRYQIVRMLQDENVQSYITRVRRFAEEGKYENPFALLLKYATEHEILFKIENSDEGIMSVDGVVEGIKIETPLTLKDIDIPVIVIRVNRLFRENMTAQELYQIVRGYWKVDSRKITLAKYAFAVARGEVKEVYQINGWHEASQEREEGRKQFDGDIAPSAIRKRFIGRSVKGLFAQGDQYPIRYFNMGRQSKRMDHETE